MIVSDNSPRSFVQTARLGLGLCALVLMTACGGGGGGATAPVTDRPIDVPLGDKDPTTPTGGGTQTGAQMRSAVSALIDDYDPITYTALSTIPTSGNATYNGYFFGNLANNNGTVTDRLIGTMAMRVGFTPMSVTVSGSATDFSDLAGRDVTGSLALSGGSLIRGGNPSNDATFRASFAGILTDSSARRLDLSGQLEGDFLASGHAAIGGEATGRIEGNATVAAQNFDGGFIAER